MNRELTGTGANNKTFVCVLCGWKAIEIMDAARKAELKAEYKNLRTRPGVFQIVNKKNGKRLVRAGMDADGLMKRLRMEFMGGQNPFYTSLQKDWNEMGEEAFSFEVLELVEKPEEKTEIEIKSELADLEKKYIEQFQPYGDKGYNRNPIM